MKGDEALHIVLLNVMLDECNAPIVEYLKQIKYSDYIITLGLTQILAKMIVSSKIPFDEIVDILEDNYEQVIENRKKESNE